MRPGLRPPVISVLLAAACFLGGCFPYRAVYRPHLLGAVIDAQGKGVPGALVESCSESHWVQVHGCPRRAVTTSGPEGRFELPELREWEGCCLGEAPLPHTVVFARATGGLTGSAEVDGGPLLVRVNPGAELLP